MPLFVDGVHSEARRAAGADGVCATADDKRGSSQGEGQVGENGGVDTTGIFFIPSPVVLLSF